MRVIAELSSGDLNDLLVALQERIRNESGLITPLGLREARFLHDRLELLSRDEDDPLPEASNDASAQALSDV